MDDPEELLSAAEDVLQGGTFTPEQQQTLARALVAHLVAGEVIDRALNLRPPAGVQPRYRILLDRRDAALQELFSAVSAQTPGQPMARRLEAVEKRYRRRERAIRASSDPLDVLADKLLAVNALLGRGLPGERRMREILQVEDNDDAQPTALERAA